MAITKVWLDEADNTHVICMACTDILSGEGQSKSALSEDAHSARTYVRVSEEIKPLVFPLTRKGITYLLESETEHTRTVRATFPGASDWMEVFEKRINAAREIQGVKIPASEAFPGDEAFGKWAWTFTTEAQCRSKAAELDAKVAARIAFKQSQASLEAPNGTDPVPTSHPATEGA